MKKLAIILIMAAFAFHSCNASQQKNNNNEISAETTAVSHIVGENVTAPGGSIKLTKAIFLNKVWDYENSPEEWIYKGDKPALIDFYADWCGPCKIAAPILEEISNEYSEEIYVYKIDTEVEKELAAVFGIRGIPAFLYIPTDGQPVMMSGIARSKEGTKQMFKENIDKYLLTSN
jgi:thioredoxin 1